MRRGILGVFLGVDSDSEIGGSLCRLARGL